MEDKKNIVIMAWRDIWHPNAGGAEVYIQKVAEYLRDKGFNIFYLTSRYPGSESNENKLGINYVRRGNAITIYYLIPKYFRKNLKKNTDLLIENYNSIPFRIPKYFDNTLTVIHHLPEDNEVWNSNYKFTENKFLQFFLSFGIKFNAFLRNPIGKFFLKQLVDRYSSKQNIITVSPSSKDELIAKGFDEKKISIIYNGIPLEVANDISKPKDQINITSVGRLRPTKKIEKGIEMIKYSKDKLNIKDIVLNIAGKGEAEEYLKELTGKYKLEDNVKFLGYISEEEKKELLYKSHLHIQFSEKEGWGITVIEAASQATPTICYNVPGLKDSVNEGTGYMIGNSLEDTWSKAISDIQNEKEEYISKKKNCLEWAKKFEWDEQLRKIDQYLD